jgi:methionyl-tRNA synthetase
MATKFYITTPIFYANDVPHIGHTGTTVFADIVARYQRALGKDVFFLTGTDEHGEKVALSAEKAGLTPQVFVDDLSKKWQEYWEKLDISNDQFMRTSSDGHKKVASELLQKLYDKGDIYKDLYKGMYCIGCEEFKADKDLVDGKCPEHRPDQIVYREEESYFFKISKYIPEVKRLIESGEFPIEPENKKNEMLARLNDEVRDLSISRQNIAWGIPLPWDPSHTTYVWTEALMNYYSATRIWNKEDFWPADVHFVGKGINWFHTVIWPALLLALELPLPKKVYVHGHYNVEGKKMGKSLGNVISPQELIDKYGIDGTRYLLAASMPYADDSDVSFKWFNEKYNADLANGLGNLVSRVAKLAEGKTYENAIFDIPFEKLVEQNILLKEAYENFKLQDVIAELHGLVVAANEYLSLKEPWKKSGEEKELVLSDVINRILTIAILSGPVIPETTLAIRDIFATGPVKPSKILFQRAEVAAEA